ncbi:MAG: CoA pyrophosphatase [Actinomycetota bacterium]|nr:CoA pyrophosphatase [Actinomycetota bacterium]
MSELECPPDLDMIVARVTRHTPTLVAEAHRQGRVAATALILHAHVSSGPRVLLIERTVRATDHWSGQMALPGGRPDPSDPDLLATAIRETREEVGIQLPGPVGRLDDIGAFTAGVVVSPFVFVVDEEPELELHPREVQNAGWITLSYLSSPEAATNTWYQGRGPFPAIRWGRSHIWGLTYRTLTGFLQLIGYATPLAR